MRYCTFPLALSIAFAVPFASADITKEIVCPLGQPPENAEHIDYNFKSCKENFTKDEQNAYCPLLGAYLLYDYKEVPIEVHWIKVNPQGGDASASVEFPQYGEYELVLSYTPFVYSSVVVTVNSQDNMKIVNFTAPTPQPSKTITVAPTVEQDATGVLEILFPNAIDSVNPYAADAELSMGLEGSGGQWSLSIDCFNLPKVAAFVNDVSRGCFEGEVNLSSPRPQIQLEPCESYWKKKQ